MFFTPSTWSLKVCTLSSGSTCTPTPPCRQTTGHNSVRKKNPFDSAESLFRYLFWKERPKKQTLLMILKTLVDSGEEKCERLGGIEGWRNRGMGRWRDGEWRDAETEWGLQETNGLQETAGCWLPHYWRPLFSFFIPPGDLVKDLPAVLSILFNHVEVHWASVLLGIFSSNTTLLQRKMLHWQLGPILHLE